MDKRRKKVTFDPFHFESQKKKGKAYSLEETFEEIYKTNHWNNTTSLSGEGSDRQQTEILESMLPHILKELHVQTLLDLPCGDFNWMQYIDLTDIQYIGGDIIPQIISNNQTRFGNDGRRFLEIDLISGKLPAADLLLCRDCLVHFSFEHFFQAIKNIKNSQIRYLLTTTFPECESNTDIVTGDWRPLNLENAPIYFPEPLLLLTENNTEGGGAFKDKSLGLWKVADIPVGL